MNRRKVAFSKRYAHGTTTAAPTTRGEIERTLQRFGCNKFACAIDPPRAAIYFEHEARRVRFEIPDPRAQLKGYQNSPSETQVAAEERRLWRSLLMAIKANLDMVFLPYMQLADGRTFAEAAADPEFEQRLTAIGRPSLLALGTGGGRGDALDAGFRETPT